MSQLSFQWIATFTSFITRPSIVLKQPAKRGWNVASGPVSSSWTRSFSVPFLYSDRFFVSRTRLNSRRHRTANDYSSKNKNDPNNSDNPFVVLGVSIHSDWETVQRAFVQLALKHHPDTSSHHGNGEGTTDDFLRIRAALEHIRSIKFGTNNKKTSSFDNDNDAAYDWRQAPDEWSDLEYEAWLRFVNDPTVERDYLSFDMSESTKQEVMDAYKTMQHGNAVGHDKGGYWEMARQIVEREERRQALRGGAEPQKQLHAGEAYDDDKALRGLRRQRKR